MNILLCLETTLKNQGAKIGKYVVICSICTKKTAYTRFKKRFEVLFSDICITFACRKTCLATYFA